MQNSKIESLATPLAVLLAGILIAAAVLWNGSHRAATDSAKPSYPAVDISKVKTANQPFIGKADAPITIAYWLDYQCPFCRKAEEDTLPQLIREYVDTGKVKIVFKDYQFLGPDSQTAGIAESAVWEVAPSKFPAWHKAMYDKQDAENAGWGNKADVLALTKEILGAQDAASVERLMMSKAKEYQAAMDADKVEGASFGVSGTPSFIIGKKLIVGAVPYAELRSAIEAVK